MPEQLEQEAGIEHRVVHRRQAQALSRIGVREVLRDLVDTGVVSTAVAESASEGILLNLRGEPSTRGWRAAPTPGVGAAPTS